MSDTEDIMMDGTMQNHEITMTNAATTIDPSVVQSRILQSSSLAAAAEANFPISFFSIFQHTAAKAKTKNNASPPTIGMSFMTVRNIAPVHGISPAMGCLGSSS